MSDQILIIDDEEHIRRMMRLTLEVAGYGVGEAGDGREGIELYGDGSSWDAVILDQKMPGMDGLETLRELKRQNPEARVVMATAYASIELAVDAMKLGATDFVRKPMTPESLRNAVTAAITKPSTKPVTITSIERDAPRARKLPTQTITMNGFTILDDEETPVLAAEQRRFIVMSPEDHHHEVVVEVDEEVIAFVQRMTGRRVEPDNSFWTSQARRLLSEFLWNEGKAPPMKRLILKDLDPEKLMIAGRWESRRGA